jgi:hypothetical protein
MLFIMPTFVPHKLLYTHKSNLNLANALATVKSDPRPYRLLTFLVPRQLYYFITRPVFAVRSWHLAKPPCWKTTPCRLYVIAYLIYSQLPSILEVVAPSTT